MHASGSSPPLQSGGICRGRVHAWMGPQRGPTERTFGVPGWVAVGAAAGCTTHKDRGAKSVSNGGGVAEQAHQSESVEYARPRRPPVTQPTPARHRAEAIELQPTAGGAGQKDSVRGWLAEKSLIVLFRRAAGRSERAEMKDWARSQSGKKKEEKKKALLWQMGRRTGACGLRVVCVRRVSAGAAWLAGSTKRRNAATASRLSSTAPTHSLLSRWRPRWEEKRGAGRALFKLLKRGAFGCCSQAPTCQRTGRGGYEEGKGEQIDGD
jgi:hypothetical protein